MPIQEVAAPEQEAAKVLKTLTDMISAGQIGTPALGKADPTSLSFVLSTPIAFLPLDSIERKPDLPIDEKLDLSIERTFDLDRSAKPEGWRFYVSADRKTSIATVRTTAIDFQIKEISEGPAVTAVTLGLDIARRHGLVQRPTFGLWQLVVPSLYVMALWLRADTRDKDLFVPLRPTEKDFPIDLVPVEGFTEQLIKLAEAAKNESWSVEKRPTAH